RILRILPRQIEIEGILHYAPAHEFSPDEIRGRPGELRMARKHARIRLPVRFPRLWLSSCQQEGGSDVCSLRTRRTQRTFCRQVVSGGAILHAELRETPVYRTDKGLAEEVRLPPQIGSLAICQPEIDFLEMRPPVMTGD